MLRHEPVVPGGDRKPVITWAALDEYYRMIATLNRQYPECWHLILQAEDRCRSDHLERVRRSLTLIEARLPMDLNFDVQQPWIGRCKGSDILESGSADSCSSIHCTTRWKIYEQTRG